MTIQINRNMTDDEIKLVLNKNSNDENINNCIELFRQLCESNDQLKKSTESINKYMKFNRAH